MKNILLFTLFLSFSIAAFAQINSDPESFELSVDVNEVVDLEAKFYLANNFDDPMDLLWKTKTINAPEEWNTYLCDINLCYPPGVEECDPAKPNNIGAGSDIPISFHVLLAGKQGSGEFEVEIMDSANPSEVLITIPITVNAISTSTKEITLEEINIFPNPASTYFSITENNLVESIEIYNVVGKQVKSFDATVNGSYSISDLSDGMYLVRLIDESGKVAKVLRISKR